MIELKNDQLCIRFSDIHPEARLTIEFQRTLRIPDDGSEYPLPPGLGRFPVRHVDDYAANLDPQWLRRGGVIFPMYQSEAMWLNFNSRHVKDHCVPYPFAIKIATGKINAVSGGEWSGGLNCDPQNYVVSPDQPWLDGYSVKKGLIRQFVAMPLGSGHSAEEQVTGKAEHGGLQIEVIPMKREVFDRRFPKVKREVFDRRFRKGKHGMIPAVSYSPIGAAVPTMALAPGGKMQQKIYSDPYDLDDWDLDHSSRCFVHITNTMIWKAITGSAPLLPPPTAKEYASADLPWFAYYSDAPAVDGSKTLAGINSVREFDEVNGGAMLPENESVHPKEIVTLRKGLRENEVRDGVF